MDPIAKVISARKDKLIRALQGLTAVGLVLTAILMIHVGPLSLFIFMTAAQGLILVSVIVTSIILLTQRAGITREHFAPGEVIFRKGDVGNKVYIVVQGEVEVIDEEPGKGERIVSQLRAGQSFGALALIREEPRGATVRSRTETSVYSVDRESFRALLHAAPLRKMVEEMVEERSKTGQAI